MIVPVLSVKDVNASLKFYNEKLGFKTDLAFAGPDGVNTFAGVSLGNSTFMLDRPQEGQVEHAGNGVVFMIYLAENEDIDAVYADVQAKGVAIKETLKTEYWGDRAFSILDPDGYYLTVCKTVENPDMEKISDIMSGKTEA
jgi:uncharacterized glyoxalase superfamily protein PhnB